MRTVVVVTAILAASAPAAAWGGQPWTDEDPAGPPERYELGAVGVRAEAEYRAQALYINPLSLNTETERRLNLFDHRLRLGGTVDYDETVLLTLSTDWLDGVLWGDNGQLGLAPEPNSGLNATTRNPNVTRPCIRYRPSRADESEAMRLERQLDPNAYGYALCEADVVSLRHLYAQVNTPVGALRVGRQAVSQGMGVQTGDGNGRQNRFGVGGAGDIVDRIMFATKPLEAFKPKAARNSSEHEGLIVAVAYDKWVSDSVSLFGDDVHQAVVGLQFKQPEFGFGRDLQIVSWYVHRWDSQYATRIHTFGLRAHSRFGDFWTGFDVASNLGTTREVSEAYSLLTGDPVVEQPVRQLGARAVARYDRPRWGAYLELDYASGDEDPQPGTPLSQFRWSEDNNVGLLLFEHIVRFQSARAAAAGVETVRRLGATTFPPERVDTRGAFTGALAVFPQLDVRPHEDVLLRAGVLLAWAPQRLIDPVATLQAEDGTTIEDDLVNFAGGKAGSFYGTELDGRFQWRFVDHFSFDLEGAVLFPGDALQDENGNAVRSVLVQGRTTFYY
ncbi:MAG: alginate export family protein [Deltaproteobacteria bacterium]|nr:alginate export family protein [Deltaproteobacteria bacterium]